MACTFMRASVSSINRQSDDQSKDDLDVYILTVTCRALQSEETQLRVCEAD